MFKIALCDDDHETYEQLQKVALLCFDSLQIQIDEFSNSKIFSAAMHQGNQWDLIILDTKLFNINGFEIGQFLEKYENGLQSHILFVSMQEDHLIDYFKMRPIGFLLKPLVADEIEENIKFAMAHVKDHTAICKFSISKVNYRIPYNLIRYFENSDKKVIIHGFYANYQCYGKLENFVNDAAHQKFVRIHYSYLVNWSAVIAYQSNRVILDNGMHLPVSRKYQKNAKDACKTFF